MTTVSATGRDRRSNQFVLKRLTINPSEMTAERSFGTAKTRSASPISTARAMAIPKRENPMIDSMRSRSTVRTTVSRIGTM